jgi:uncharacterized protein YbaR (Trm112 family)
VSTSTSPEEGTVICPYCEKAIDKVVLLKRDLDNQIGLGKKFAGTMAVVTCPHCNKMLTVVPAKLLFL